MNSFVSSITLAPRTNGHSEPPLLIGIKGARGALHTLFTPCLGLPAKKTARQTWGSNIKTSVPIPNPDSALNHLLEVYRSPKELGCTIKNKFSKTHKPKEALKEWQLLPN